jgi:microcystin degradation protein MlrC
MAMIRRRDYHLENEIPEAFRGTRSAFGATFEAADKFGWSLVHPVSSNPNPSGIFTDEAFETITAMVLDAVDMKGPTVRTRRRRFGGRLPL